MYPSACFKLSLAIGVLGLVMVARGEFPPMPSFNTYIVATSPTNTASKPDWTVRKVEVDGQIIITSTNSIEWKLKDRLWRVEHREDLTKGEWKTVGYTSNAKEFIHDNPSGFYRVVETIHPTPPIDKPPMDKDLYRWLNHRNEEIYNARISKTNSSTSSNDLRSIAKRL